MRLLMLTIGYPPHRVGGTEVYVAGLVDELLKLGHSSEVAYVVEVPDGTDIAIRSSASGATLIHQVLVPRSRFRLESILFDKDLQCALVESFRRLVRQRAPDVVHVHPLQLGFESFVMEALKADGRRVVLTYHSSTTCCARGDLVRFGERACDGVMRQVECSECLLHVRGVPRPLAAVFARLPQSWYRSVHGRASGKLKSFASLPLVVEGRRESWARAVAASDRIVAVCEWVAKGSRANGADPGKIVLCRHGHRFTPEPTPACAGSPVRFGYVGRLSPEKGVGLLLDAVSQLGTDAPFELEIASATFDLPRPSAEERLVIEQVRGAVARDPRIRIVGAIPDAALTRTIGTWDALVVPSLWFESGPQVVYEAFAASTPVIGSRRGGIAELVTDGVTGFLFEPADVVALATLLREMAIDPWRLRSLRAQIPAVRTTADVAREMVRLYEDVVERHAAAG